MAKGNYSGISCINEHIAITYKHSKPDTISKYRGVLYQINGDVKDNGYSDNPRQYDEETIEFLVGLWKERDLAISTKNWYLHILRRYLAYFSNPVIEGMGIDFGQDIRPNVNWLSDEEVEHLMRMGKTPLEEVVIHLELCLGSGSPRSAGCASPTSTLTPTHAGATSPSAARARRKANGEAFRSTRSPRPSSSVGSPGATRSSTRSIHTTRHGRSPRSSSFGGTTTTAPPADSTPREAIAWTAR